MSRPLVHPSGDYLRRTIGFTSALVLEAHEIETTPITGGAFLAPKEAPVRDHEPITARR